MQSTSNGRHRVVTLKRLPAKLRNSNSILNEKCWVQGRFMEIALPFTATERPRKSLFCWTTSLKTKSIKIFYTKSHRIYMVFLRVLWIYTGVHQLHHEGGACSYTGENELCRSKCGFYIMLTKCCLSEFCFVRLVRRGAMSGFLLKSLLRLQFCLAGNWQYVFPFRFLFGKTSYL